MKSTLRYKEKYEFNPLNEKTEIVISENSKMVNVGDRRVVIVKDRKLYDITKEYVSFISNQFKLSKKTGSLLMYIMFDSKLGDDECQIDIDKIKDITGYNSLGPIYAAFNELVEKDLIARTRYDDRYFINHNFIFKIRKQDEIKYGTILNVPQHMQNNFIEDDKSNEPMKETGAKPKAPITEELPQGFSEDDLIDY